MFLALEVISTGTNLYIEQETEIVKTAEHCLDIELLKVSWLHEMQLSNQIGDTTSTLLT